MYLHFCFKLYFFFFKHYIFFYFILSWILQLTHFSWKIQGSSSSSMSVADSLSLESRLMTTGSGISSLAMWLAQYCCSTLLTWSIRSVQCWAVIYAIASFIGSLFLFWDYRFLRLGLRLFLLLLLLLYDLLGGRLADACQCRSPIPNMRKWQFHPGCFLFHTELINIFNDCSGIVAVTPHNFRNF